MNVAITGIGLLSAGGPWEVPEFRPREHILERKHIKLMTRGVQLGVAGIRLALAQRPGWEAIPPERRGIYVGSPPAGSDPADLAPAFQASMTDGAFDPSAFGELGLPVVPPLWLVKGLSNNVLGYASAYHDIQGVNGNRCEGRAGGIASVVDGARAIAEGRADIVVAGGADSLIGVDGWLGLPTGEGAAFFVLERASDHPHAPRLVDGGVRFSPDLPGSPPGQHGELGAAAGVIELAERLHAGDRDFTVEVVDPSGTLVWVEIG